MKHLLNLSLQRESNELLITNTRIYNDLSFNTGDRAHHKQENNRKWGGPGTVIGQGHKQVFVRHSSELVRVHSSRLIHVDNANFEKSLSSNESINHTDNVNEVSRPLIGKLQHCNLKILHLKKRIKKMII